MRSVNMKYRCCTVLLDSTVSVHILRSLYNAQKQVCSCNSTFMLTMAWLVHFVALKHLCGGGVKSKSI